MSFSFESMHDFFDDQIPEDWVRCSFCGTPMTLEVRTERVLLWCKGGCKRVQDERRVLREEASYGS